MAEAETKTEGKPTAGGGSKVVPLLLGVNSLLLAAVLALLVLRPGGAARVGQAAEPPHGAEAGHGEAHGEKGARDEKRDGKGKDGKEGLPGPTLRLPDFIVHLRDVDADRYARLSFELELPDEKAKEAVNARLPQIRDAFLAYLSDRTAEDMRGSEAMLRVKTALSQKLAEVAPAAPVRGLYVTELVVQ
jgi:flagellar FliL protein